MAIRGIQFSGIHEDALVGTDTRLTGVIAQTSEIAAVLETLKSSAKLSKHVSGVYKAKTPIELTLTREPENKADQNAIRLSHGDKTLGYLSKALAARVAPVLDDNVRFTAHLSEIKPWWDWRGKKERYSVDVRLELLTQTGRAPNLKTRDTLLAGFEAARLEDLDKIATVIPEQIDRFEAGGKTITQRYDQERSEKSYYTGGFLIARGKVDGTAETEPDFVRDNLDADLKSAIKQQLNALV